MRYLFSLGLLIVSLVLATGCGGSSGTPSAPQAASPQLSGEISQVAQTFLEALRTGDSATATTQLTPNAQQQMRASEMDFQLLANEAASYKIGKVELMAENEAIVETVWSEPDPNGQLVSEQWTLALQQTQSRWGILGIVAQSGPDQPPMVMDFENPGQQTAPPNTAGTSQPGSAAPRQATLPATQDPFRQ